ncbi:MAG: superoxide dismutase [Bdellovibrionaceae bacterium]|nr:superoxide dismutase [Pseudobdellovibrionaceae bacterium]
MAAPFELPPLPFSSDALAPVISAQTLGFHHGKHHKAYIDKLNELVKGKPYAEMSLLDIIMATTDDNANKPIYNNAGQAWNHDFYWHSLTPKQQDPSSRMKGLLEKSFGSMDEFRKQFSEAAVTQFGSGWAWLVSNGHEQLEIMKTGNADTPWSQGRRPLLTLDVWEHAYYLDYQNRRPDYAKAVIEKLLNWEFAEKNLAG